MALPPYRTTSALVAGVNPGVDPSIDLTPFIAIANQITTDVCGPFITGKNSQGYTVQVDTSYTDGFVGSKMELIERWLSAHFYAVYDSQLAAAKAGSVAAQFQYKVALDLRNTQFGEQAMMLDTAQGLASLNNSNATKRKIRIGGFWAGRRWDCWGDVDFGAIWSDLTVCQ
jgi:hypothetical protein